VPCLTLKIRFDTCLNGKHANLKKHDSLPNELSYSKNSSNRSNDHPILKGVEFKQIRNDKKLSFTKFMIWSDLTRNCKLYKRARSSDPG